MTPIVGLVIAGLISYFCHQRSQEFEAQYGRSPWGWSPTLWAVVGFLLGLIGFCLLVIAERRGRKAAANRPVGYGQPQYGSQYGQPQYGSQFGGPPPQYGQQVPYGQPAYGQPANPYAPPQFGGYPPPPSAPPTAPPAAPPTHG